ncbi:MAG: hypothetical protein V7643_3601 [Mycobacterium sp.]|jgi:hypothetical protein
MCPLADGLCRHNFGRAIGRELVERMQTAHSVNTSSRDDRSSKTTESVTMAILKLPARRLILAGGFAVAIAAAPAVAVVAVPTHSPTIAACPGGESEDTFTGECLPDLVPNSPEVGETSPGGLPEVDNIPCTGGNSGQCIGLSEEEQSEGPMAVPHSSVSSSP